MRTKDKLTDKQQRFVEEYLIDCNATQACIRAGFSAHNADKIGPQLLAKGVVIKAIAEAKGKLSKKTGISAERVINELSAIGFSKVTNVVDWKNGSVTITPSENLDEATKSALSSVEEISGGKRFPSRLKIRMHDKVKALQLLGQHLGLLDGKASVTVNTQVNVNIGAAKEQLLEKLDLMAERKNQQKQLKSGG